MSGAGGDVRAQDQRRRTHRNSALVFRLMFHLHTSKVQNSRQDLENRRLFPFTDSYNEQQHLTR